ncbi:MAG: hypothetical protein NDI82_05140 [Anaeromyxobacteraceae bacterium]|nr:hypothetical protein [Anaeromyxobacteraceae bacterium]
MPTPTPPAPFAKLEIDTRATRLLAEIGVSVYMHDRFYGLVADASRPSGFRLVGSALTLGSLQRKLARRMQRHGTL